MDLKRLKQTYERLQGLDERLTYKVRPRSGGALTRPGVDQLEERMRELATYTVELKEILEEVILSAASRPKTPPGSTPSGSTTTA